MFYVRTVATASGSTAVQVVRYQLRKRIVLKHIGSARIPEELQSLRHTAQQWIMHAMRQRSLFPAERKIAPSLVPIDKLRNLGFRYSFAREVIRKLFHLFRFSRTDQLLLDLVMIRIIKPASKLESLELLVELFGIKHHRAHLYRRIPTMAMWKEKIEKQVIAIAKAHFAFNFTIVFYDVTTLYFESFSQDPDTIDPNGTVVQHGLRKNGFSKDNKSNQPQIIIGLIVTTEGFPVSYEVFEGNTFEGKTFIPTISAFKDRHTIHNLTVVADSAMISHENVEKLIEKKLSYIVGARVANLTQEQMRMISNTLSQVDEATMRMETKRGLLVCDFSLTRYKKDKREMDNQIAKAEKLLKRKTQTVQRTKFLKYNQKTTQELNTTLIEKTTLLLGIKGYYTNLTDESDKTIIDHYHNLWHVEHAFRIAKNDLVMRPIYHFKSHTIKAHILLCFMALSVCKYMELKTGKSTRMIVKLLKSVTDARLLNTLTNEEIVIRSEISPHVHRLMRDLSLSH